MAQVYPRVGGGNELTAALQAQKGGLSPRGRGKHRGAALGIGAIGSIPAWAGETICALVRPWEKTVYPRVGGGNQA